MKELILVRHAKSDWGTEFLKDIDRPLNERGYRDAYALSDWYAKNKTRPDLILSSTAIRALNTAFIFARRMDLAPVRLEEKIYEAGTDRLLSVIRQQEGAYESIMLFGHNPSISNVCNNLSDDLFFDDIPTCGIVSYNLKMSSWVDLKSKTAKLNYFQFPKDFKNKD